MPNLFSRLPFRRSPVQRKLVQKLSAKAADPIETSLQALGRSRKAQVAPALLLATGAGAAFWWWTQWARGSAESEAAGKGEKDEPREG